MTASHGLGIAKPIPAAIGPAWKENPETLS